MPPRKDPRLLALVEDCMIRGFTVAELETTVEEHKDGFACSLRTLKRYRAEIVARWQTEEVELRPQRRAEFRQILRVGYRDSMVHRQYIAAAAFAKIMAKLDGLEAPARLDVNIGIEVRAMTPLQRQQEINELLARRAIAIDGTQAGPLQALPPAPTRKRKRKRANGKANGRG